MTIWFWKKDKYPTAEEAISRGGILDKDLTQGSMSDLKIKGGHNIHEDKFYIQITDRKTLYSFRIYLTHEEFKNFLYGMRKTLQFTEDKEKEKQ
jgi:hypothetical protein